MSENQPVPDKGTKTSMFRASTVTPAQMELVNAIIEFNGGDSHITLTKLAEAHMALRQRKYSPYFIYRNMNLRSVKNPGVFDLSKLHVGKEKAAAKAKKEAKPKHEVKAKAKTKKASKRQKIVQPENIEAPAPIETPATE